MFIRKVKSFVAYIHSKSSLIFDRRIKIIIISNGYAFILLQLLNMKHTLNSSRLVWFVVLWALVLLFAGTANGLEIKKLNAVSEHISRLHSLYLWDGSSFAGMITRDRHLNITNGLVVGNGSVGSNMATVAWGVGNGIGSNSQWAWIAGGEWNSIQWGANSVIGWWKSNVIGWNNAVVVGWENNQWTSAGAVVVGWNGNTSSNDGWVAFGGSGNTALWASSLVLWEGAKWQKWSFAWNGEAGQDSARIEASNWILVGTYDTVTGVNLVVKWAMKIGGDTSSASAAWEIRMVDGCFYAYDGVYWHVVNQSSTWCTAITTAKTCKFGNVELQAWDTVTAYKVPISSDCSAESAAVTCNNWELKVGGVEYKYPYCYTR